MRDAVETYFQTMSEGHRIGAGTKETSFYPQLANLLDAMGNNLKPRVRVVFQLRNTGAGIPDGGFYSSEQSSAIESESPLDILSPARGVLEVKPPSDDVEDVAKLIQVTKYAEHYGQVLVTNFRDFVLVDRDHQGEIRCSERLTLAATEKEFWDESLTPKRFADRVGDQLVEYLHRVLVRRVSLSKPQDVAMLLASYARDMKARLEHQPLDDLAPLRSALESALGISFETEDGAHFFRSTVVQTLFYGMFSSWVLQTRGLSRDRKEKSFDWRLAGWALKVPSIQSLFTEFTRPDSFEQLGLTDVMDWTGEMLNRIDPEGFFARFSEAHAVQYFYEPFLEAFDPELRKQLGVWYTPHEIVTYMVERVDRALREELGVGRGLADSNVYVLDPCTGTGSYLVGVLRRIHQTLKEEGGGALIGEDLKTAVKERLFGFELLPAPFVVAHLQMGLALQELDAPLTGGSNERPGIFLTNALTGWDAVSEDRYSQTKARNLLATLDRERSDAGEVKQRKPILVVIGNPPYNGYAGVAVDEERDLSNTYRVAKRTKKPQGQGLNDLYVRFFRMAERRIVEQSGRGIVCYISNYSWLDHLSFPAMRERFLDVFDNIWIDNLNGDKYKTGKVTPEGKPDPSVFSTEHNREGIQVGTAIALMVRKAQHHSPKTIKYREFWGTTKKQQLMDGIGKNINYVEVAPANELGLPFTPAAIHGNYLSWPLLNEVFPISFPGVTTARDDFVIDIDREVLHDRLKHYFDSSISDSEIKDLAPRSMNETGTFNAGATRATLITRGFLVDRIVRYMYRPFDLRWLYWEPKTGLLDRNRLETEIHLFQGNLWLEARQKFAQADFDRGIITQRLSDNFGNGTSLWFPKLLSEQISADMSQIDHRQSENLSQSAKFFLSDLGLPQDTAFYSAISIIHSPIYRATNSAALRLDFPRIPFPSNKNAFKNSASIGKKLSVLLDIEQTAPGVGTGPILPELREISVLMKVGGGNIDIAANDLLVNVGWGHGASGKPVMPGRGRALQRDFNTVERDSIALSGQASPLGNRTFDIYLNDRVFWQNIPERVWEYSLGGYQVLKKWLSYRETLVLGRHLNVEEVRTFTEIARRIAAILLLEPELDANYARVIAETWDWQAAVAREQEEKVKGIGPQP